MNKHQQELQMLSSVTLNCQITMTIVMNSGSQLSEMETISRKFTRHIMCLSWSIDIDVFVFVFGIFLVIAFLLVRSCLLITLIICLKGHKFLG